MLNVVFEKAELPVSRATRKQRMYTDLVSSFCQSGEDCARVVVAGGKTGIPMLDAGNIKVVSNSCNYEVKNHVDEYKDYRPGSLPHCIVAGDDLFFFWKEANNE